MALKRGPMRNHEEQQTFQQIAGVFDEPAFIRRARQTENAWTFLLQRAKREYLERLKMPLMRLARLEMLSSNFQLIGNALAPEAVTILADVFQTHTPRLKRQLKATACQSELDKEVRLLVESFRRFNSKWESFIQKLDYERVNILRDGYNKYYVLEKECALQSFRTAYDSFRPLPPVSEREVLQRFPLLPSVLSDRAA